MLNGSLSPYDANPLGAAAPPLRTASTADVDEQAAQLRGWSQHYVQLSPGAFAGDFIEVDLGAAQLFFETTSTTLFQTGAIAPGVTALGIPLQFGGDGSFCGQPIAATKMHCFSGRSGFEYCSPGGLLMAGLIISSATLAGELGEEQAEQLRPRLETPGLLSIDTSQRIALHGLLDRIIGMTRTSPELLRDARFRASLGRAAVEAFIAPIVASHPTRDDHCITQAVRRKLIRDIRDLVLSRPEEPPTVAELCQRLQVSRRTLQYCFAQTLHCGPLEFIRAIRLNQVRAMLLRGARVSEAAAHWGFWHFGNFAKDYRLLFNRLPSAEKPAA